MLFDLPKEQSSIIKVIGVGGGGCNAVNHMFEQGIKDVNFIICNTDSQALDISTVPTKIQLGPSLTKGRGAGSHPHMGKDAAMESLQDIKSILERNTEMVFITAGMGGGTGTGGAPVIAKTAKELGILTIGIVTLPFAFEGKRRKQQAEEGLNQLKQYVDAILIISNDKLREIYGNLPFHDAFAKADDILSTAAKGIAEIITVPGYVNVDFEDVKTVLRDSGLAILGSATSEGENRSLKAVEAALASPLLNDNDISGAKNILLNISSGSKPVLMDEISEITEFVQHAAGNDCDIIWGNCTDDTLGEKLMVTVIATGFETDEQRRQRIKSAKVVVQYLDTEHSSKNIKSQDVPPEIVTEEKSDIKNDAKQKTKEEINPRQFTFEFEGNFFEIKTDDVVEMQHDPLIEAVAENKTEKNEIEITIKKDAKETESPKPEKEELKPAHQKKEINLIRNEDKLNVINNADPERIKRLKSMSLKLNNLDEIEKTPAYQRRNVELNDTPESSEINISKYSIAEDENKGLEIKKNNPFLHDNVD